MLSKSQLAFWRTAAEVLLETRIRVLVVDDFMAFQRLILWIFHDWAELKVVGQAVDGAEAIAKAQELQPDVIVLDIGLPDSNGIEVARSIRAAAKDARIVFSTENPSIDVAREALKVGDAFVLKSDATSDILKAIEAVVHGEKFVSRSLAGSKLI